MNNVFDREAIRTFRFVDCGFDADTGVARLAYAFDDGPDLVETVTLPGAPFALDAARARAAMQALRLLHLVAGVSYYKAAVPRDIRIDGYGIDGATAALLEDVYLQGLGEFAYRNGLELHGRIRFPRTDAADTASAAGAKPLGLRRHALVAIGGGKDSLVSIEALRAAGIAQTVAWIGGSQLIAACAARTGLPTLNIQRQLAPELFEYNRQGAYNGHIPVTAINSAILAFAAIVLDADQVVFSNERSASYGSLIEGTGEVNHQWSKGWAFEQALAGYLQREVAADLRYYSLLRPLSELAVARQFAKIDRYDAWFSSCNRNFHLLGERPTSRWCGVCPKCHFVFLALAPFMPKPRLVGIFGRNLLDDEAQVPGYDALMEYRDHKPFECVGEARESRAAMAALAARPEWREDAVVVRFREVILPQLGGEDLAIAPLLVPDPEHGIPEVVWSRLHAYFAA
ncbi:MULTISPECIES: UDP-N-acetyl-alpha-D-muramoyl-L-alanyl-L-glutamate epimerase [unclassified Luteimonas]|uniref:UDP-N-acetyl-alpha-D-muramoyl-L-alanyl-L- glutamate epimerase n=1 Tax=unclassified Luteimonas TaxID=2629088 RepID=UPI0018F0B4F3|nr:MULTISPECIES: UDP-N-acetyl-alpha-D-muramoyl-L-alanyl-L-glutamate epimerase [unclassified Luteimonas]MBJ6978743.1 endonuclease domain-containing protein [Luteimonas sp. MC1895]MBJ6983643.1 endonuclease domain-containing protein [Luteimonas sp. MC1750]QQO06485.1 endonuclease domain-containing protein [Luteimonas sp. MC1750]